MNQKFFDERSDQSEVKARIVSKYFSAWANVIVGTVEKNNGRMAYVDLYAGPGRYKDGAASTPLLILQNVISHPRLPRFFVGYFNDIDRDKTETLKNEIEKLPGIETLKYKPHVLCGAISTDAEKYFNATRMIPSFTFIDPWGYKGLSLKIVNGVIKDWGCECVFFFNYNRINAGISNEIVEQHMNALFGADRANKLRIRVEGCSPGQRESMILEEMTEAIREMGGKYILPFRFKNPQGRPTHHLIFVSKHFLGYDIMKEIMTKESSSHEEGVPSFTYSPADASMPLLFSLTQPLSKLQKSLTEKFAGKEISFKEMYESHSVDTPYIKKNYREILKKLEQDGQIVARTTKSRRTPGTFADHILIRFL